jgi:hypothetical protein
MKYLENITRDKRDRLWRVSGFLTRNKWGELELTVEHCQVELRVGERIEVIDFTPRQAEKYIDTEDALVEGC